MRLLEVFAGRFFEDRRREGPEGLAVFDAAIQNFFHFRPPRIGQNAALAQRARAPFDAALKPSQNFSLGDMPRGGLNERSFFQLADLNVVARTPEFFHRAANFLGIELRTPPGMIHHEFTRASQNLMIYYECRADREARVTRRGLDVNALERRRIEDAPVGHAVK